MSALKLSLLITGDASSLIAAGNASVASNEKVKASASQVSATIEKVEDANVDVAASARKAASATQAEAAAVQNLGSAATEAGSAARVLKAANDEVAQAAKRAEEALRGQSAAQRNFQAIIDRSTGVRSPTAGATFAGRADDIKAYGKALDDLRAKYDPIFAAEQRLRQELDGINSALRTGAINQATADAAIVRAQAAHNQQTGVKPQAGRPTLSGYQMQGLGYQINDAATMALMGASPFQILASQGGQVFQTLQQNDGGVRGSVDAIKNGAKEGAAAIATMLGPIGMVATAFGVTAVAATAFYALTRERAKSLDEAFEAHIAKAKRLQETYTKTEASVRGGALGSQNVAAFQSRQAVADLDKSYKAEADDILDKFFYTNSRGGQQITLKYNDLKDQINELQKSAKIGLPDVAGFNEELARMGQNPDTTQNLRDIINEVLEFTQKTADAQRTVEQFNRNIGPGGLLRGGSAYNQADMQNLGNWRQQENAALEKSRKNFDLQMQGIGAISPAEQAAAARAREAATMNQDETGNARRLRIEQAGKLALAQAEEQLRRSQEERYRALDGSLASQAHEIELIGKTKAEAAAMAFEFEHIAQVREEAARNGVAADEAEIATIRQKADEIRRLTLQYEAQSKLDDQRNEMEMAQAELSAVNLIGPAREEQLAREKALMEVRRMGLSVLSEEGAAIVANAEALARMKTLQAQQEFRNDLRFDIEQMNRSPREQAVAQRLRGTGFGMDSKEAGVLREMDRVERMRDSVRGFWDDMQAGLERGDDFGDTVTNALKNSLLEGFGNLATDGVDKLIRQIIPMPSADSILGKAGATPAMPVYVSVVNGGLPGLPGVPGAGASGGDVLNLAEVVVPGLGKGGGSFSKVGNYKSGVDSRLTDILQVAAERSGLKVDAFSGFRAGDSRFHGKGLATDIRLFDAAGKALPNYQNAGAFRSYEQFAQMARSVQMERYPELANQFRWGGYFGGGKGKYGAMDTMHFDLGGGRVGMGGGSWSNGLSSAQRAMWPGAESVGMANSARTATAALDKLATGSTQATEGLGSFGQGLGQIGNALNSGAGAGGGGSGGGLFSWLGNIFGGGGSFKANTTAGNFFGANGTAAMGKWAEGGWTGPGAKWDPAGIVHADEYVFSAAATRAIGVRNLEKLHRSAKSGFAEGGYAGPRIMPAANGNGFGGGVNIIRNINNYAGAGVEVEENETRDPQGNIAIETNIRRIARDEMNNPARSGAKQMRSAFNLKPAVTDR